MNKDSRILIACEESQTVTTEFRKLGFYNTFSCDLLPTSGLHPEWHLQQDVTEVMNRKQYVNTYSKKSYWDMIIAFPPCTHLAVSGAKHFEQKRKDGRQQEGIDFFMLFTKIDCDRIVIENPIGIMSGIYRKPDQIIQPYMFGDPVKKSTCLWLKGLPKLKPTNDVRNDVLYYTDKRGRKQSDWNARQIIVDGKKCGYNTDEFKQHRSKTFAGIAEAMAKQWSDLPNPLVQPKQLYLL